MGNKDLTEGPLHNDMAIRYTERTMVRVLVSLFLNLSVSGFAAGSGYEYIIQDKNLDSAQLRFATRLTAKLRQSQFFPVNKQEGHLLGGRLIHQIYVSTFDRKTIGMVFLNNQKKVTFPAQVELKGAVVNHFKFNKSIIAIWFHGVPNEEMAKVVNTVKQQIKYEQGQHTVWRQIFSPAIAEVCDSRSAAVEFNPLIEKMAQSSYAKCWQKVGEGAKESLNSAAEGIKEMATLEFDMFAYWDKIQKVAVGISDFAEAFFNNPTAWIQKNVSGIESIDLSVLGEFDRDQMIGLACLTLGSEGVQGLASMLVSGPAGLSVKLFQMVSKLSLVSKLFALLKQIKKLTVDQMALFKDQLVKLAEGLIVGKHSPEKADALAGLLRVSPSMALQGFACLSN